MKTILEAYITCALWSSTICDGPEDNPGEMDGDPFDEHFSADDLAPETLATMESEIEDFLAYCYEVGATHDEWSDEQLGHDFWLTRNGHGAGFFDRGLPEGDALQDAAKTFGSVDLYVGDDGLIYQS